MPRNFLKLVLAGSVTCLIAMALPGTARGQADAVKSFKTNCVLCHAADGSGNTPSGKALGAKDLGSSEAQNKSDADLTEMITKGKGKMPAFGAKLKPEDIKQLVAYIRTMHKK
jgi:mono/diheme cytochrome c family protein